MVYISIDRFLENVFNENHEGMGFWFNESVCQRLISGKFNLNGFFFIKVIIQY